MSTGARIELQSVSKSYREGEQLHQVLKAASAVVEAGERVALLGPSGSGKSTLLNLVSAIDAPDEGRILVDETDVTSLEEPERTLFRRKHVGLVFQFFNLLSTLTVEENLLLPLELTGRLDEERRGRVRTLLERVELGDRADSFPDRLSGGEQQRVAVVRALVHEPGVVLADEPTGSLDDRAGNVVMDLLEELVRETGTTLLMVTHSVALAGRADRIIRLSRGRLMRDGEETEAWGDCGGPPPSAF